MSESPPPSEESASQKIRQEITETILPQLQAQGKDPGSKDIYPPIIKNLATKYNVHYNTVKKSWDRVLRDAGKLAPAVQQTQRTVGSVQMNVIPEPKQVQPPPAAAEPQEQQQQAAPAPELSAEQKALNVKIFSTVHESAAEALFAIAEGAWGVKVKRPDPKKYEEAGQVWSEVAEAYGWEVPKILLLVGGIAMTGQLFAVPLMAARAEALRIAEEKETAKKQ